MSISRRHHYIPQFYIRNFTDADGMLYIYDKVNNRIHHKKQSPKSVFFEDDRNTFDFSGHKLDHLEKLYSVLDEKIAKDLSGILTTQRITPEQMASMILLATLLKWRIPKSDALFNELKNDLSQEDLNISLSLKESTEHIEEAHAALQHLENSPIFRETKRVLLGVLPIHDVNKLAEIYADSFIHSNAAFPSLIGDCPVLEKENKAIDQIEDFIMPLSSDATFIYKKGSAKKILNALFFLQRDMAIIHASEKSIGCADKTHLERVVAAYQHVVKDGHAEIVNQHLFKFIV